MFSIQICRFLLETLHFVPKKFGYNVDVFFISSRVALKFDNAIGK